MVGVVRAVVMEHAIAASTLLLCLTAASLHLLIAALGELGALIESPAGAELRAGRGTGIDEAEGGIIVGGESGGVVECKIEDGVARVGGVGRVGGGVASPVGDATELLRAGEGGEGDVRRVGPAGEALREERDSWSVGWAPPVGIKGHNTYIESHRRIVGGVDGDRERERERGGDCSDLIGL